MQVINVLDTGSRAWNLNMELYSIIHTVKVNLELDLSLEILL